jgi:hypothetical protein
MASDFSVAWQCLSKRTFNFFVTDQTPRQKKKNFQPLNLKCHGGGVFKYRLRLPPRRLELPFVRSNPAMEKSGSFFLKNNISPGIIFVVVSCVIWSPSAIVVPSAEALQPERGRQDLAKFFTWNDVSVFHTKCACIFYFSQMRNIGNIFNMLKPETWSFQTTVNLQKHCV